MANLVTFAKKLWKDKLGGNTPITAAELNRMEGGINDCVTQINKLGDSVSPFTKSTIDSIVSDVRGNNVLRFRFTASNGKAYGFSLLRNGIRPYCFTDSVEVWRITK